MLDSRNLIKKQFEGQDWAYPYLYRLQAIAGAQGVWIGGRLW